MTLSSLQIINKALLYCLIVASFAHNLARRRGTVLCTFLVREFMSVHNRVNTGLTASTTRCHRQGVVLSTDQGYKNAEDLLLKDRKQHIWSSSGCYPPQILPHYDVYPVSPTSPSTSPFGSALDFHLGETRLFTCTIVHPSVSFRRIDNTKSLDSW